MKNYFQLTRKDKIGITSVGIVIVVGVVFLNVNQHRGLGEPSNVQVDSIELNSTQTATTNQDQIYSNTEESDNYESKLESFYPNEISKLEWESLGFSEKQANSIVKYRTSYGPFTSVDDVCKIYVISEKKCNELSPYMQFKKQEKQESNPIQLNINTTTPKDLEKINGIGAIYSERIIKYRNSLGGFVNKKQYKEVFGLSDKAVDNLNKQTIIDPSSLRKIKINSASKEEIKKHPYLRDWSVVMEILKYRDSHTIENLKFLTDKGLISNEIKNKLSPYIDYN